MKVQNRLVRRLCVSLVAVTCVPTLLQAGPEQGARLSLALDSQPIQREGAVSPVSYAPMLEQAKQSVVSVYTAELVQRVQNSGQSMEDLLRRRLFGQPVPNANRGAEVQEEKVPQGVGSGVIISQDGYILTNNHVIQDRTGGEADEILVRLSDNTELVAELVGRDPKSDIALIKIASEGLLALPLADSEQTKVGDIVFAIGNPLGIGLTVTSGIISATNRAIGIYGNQGYEDFIQTDAAINQGNSGGALVDIEGRLIGINSAIVSGNGGSVGLGFAIPTSLAAGIVEQLAENGEVERGVIGIRMGELDDTLAEALGALDKKGVIIEHIEEGYPAEKAGLKHGDVITEINGAIISNSRAVRLEVAKIAPGDSLKITVVRDGEPKDFTVEVVNPNELTLASKELLKGVKVENLTGDLRGRYRIPGRVNGIIVTEVDPRSPSRRVLSPGVVILEINKQPLTSVNDTQQLLRPGKQNLFYIYKNGTTRYFALRL